MSSSPDFIFGSVPLVGSIAESGRMDARLSSKDVKERREGAVSEVKSVSSKAVPEQVHGYDPSVDHGFSDKKFLSEDDGV